MILVLYVMKQRLREIKNQSSPCGEFIALTTRHRKEAAFESPLQASCCHCPAVVICVCLPYQRVRALRIVLYRSHP